MEKNIVVLADGTGQSSGFFVDEKRSNIYKLFRATRCGPDSSINPTEQLAFYDPGIGTLPAGLSFLGRVWRKIQNVVSQATGLGLTQNIVDCYAEIIRLWRPGDRIFLFGFSRGAYTVRCLAAVLTFCGVPTTNADGSPLTRSASVARRVAREGVTRVYQHVSSPKDEKYLEQREALARRFRKKYASGNSTGESNANPYFIGVFDTVAALWGLGAIAVVATLALVALAITSGALWFAFSIVVPAAFRLMEVGLWDWLAYLASIGPHSWIAIVAFVFVVTCVAAFMATHVKWTWRLEGYCFLETVHFTSWKMKFYDQQLSVKVGYARHAISIDENRASFARVKWGSPKVWRDVGKGNPIWFKQLWFAGNHSDVGGSYAENESRLSDTALRWMADEAKLVGLKVDENFLRLYPDPTGVQHDETRTSVFKYTKKESRHPITDATLHDSVVNRFEASSVLHLDTDAPYRPSCLSGHKQLVHFYDADLLIAEFGNRAVEEAKKRDSGSGQQGQLETKSAGHWARVAAEIARRKSLSV